MGLQIPSWYGEGIFNPFAEDRSSHSPALVVKGIANPFSIARSFLVAVFPGF
jgi:hypothetical protein